MANIETSQDYAKFKAIPGNRPVDQNRVLKIVTSVREGLDLLDSNPLKVYEEEGSFWIVDGQHRFHACMKLERAIPYVVVQKTTVQEIAKLNSNQKAWGTEDYVNTYCEMGLESYLQLRNFATAYGLTYRHALRMLNPSHKGLFDTFKTGVWKVTRYEKAIQYAKTLKEYAKWFKDGGLFLLEAVIKLVDNPEYDHTKMQQRVMSYNKEISRQYSTKDYLRTIEEIYNYRSQEEVRLF